MLTAVISWVADLLWPRQCAGCGRGGEPLCAACAGRLVPAAADGSATHAATRMDDALAARLVWDLKYRNRSDLALPMARLMASRLAARGLFSSAPLLAPVPLHTSRLRERGYNQAELLARALADITAAPLASPLARTRRTESQVLVGTRSARLANLAGAFTVTDPTAVRGRTVMLVDDVTTTGATAGACVRALKAAGARRVTIAVFARG